MTKIRQLICICLTLIIFKINAQNIVVGSEKTNFYLPLLKNKNVAIVANQTSRIHNTHLVDSLVELDISISKIFSPEHGFRGEEDAGTHIKNDKDPITKIKIVSLYGKNKKPKKEDLDSTDIIIFDIQDVGARFYTYISTLHYVMEASAENNIELIVFDRPNPNGHYVDGPILDDKHKSFVGLHPIPIVHGMTIGEYAKMINGEKWISKACDLKIITMDNYNRYMHYNLPVRPSPNLPNSKSINLYPSLCLFEGTNISVGRGTEYPFQHFGSPYLNSKYSFIPKSSFGSKNPKHKEKICYGTDLRFTDIYLTKLNLSWLINCYKESKDKNNFFNSFFDKLAGNNRLRLQIQEGMTEKEIRKTWDQDLNKFEEIRKKYLIY